jgi:5-carboxyvanillate decarboxylase
MSEQRLIATEEHIATPEYLEAVASLAVWPGDEPEMRLMRGVVSDDVMRQKLLDFDVRLRDMDASGTDVAVLSLNPPGVQPFDLGSAVSLARDFNDALAEIVNRRPTRFAGLGTLAPQDPRQAAQEIERIAGSLGLAGVMINSHTEGHYLDEPVYAPMLEAANALEVPVYLHPRMPSPQMLGPYNAYGMQAAVWGYQAEAGTHATRLIMSERRVRSLPEAEDRARPPGRGAAVLDDPPRQPVRVDVQSGGSEPRHGRGRAHAE